MMEMWREKECNTMENKSRTWIVQILCVVLASIDMTEGRMKRAGNVEFMQKESKLL